MASLAVSDAELPNAFTLAQRCAELDIVARIKELADARSTDLV